MYAYFQQFCLIYLELYYPSLLLTDDEWAQIIYESLIQDPCQTNDDVHKFFKEQLSKVNYIYEDKLLILMFVSIQFDLKRFNKILKQVANLAKDQPVYIHLNFELRYFVRFVFDLIIRFYKSYKDTYDFNVIYSLDFFKDKTLEEIKTKVDKQTFLHYLIFYIKKYNYWLDFSEMDSKYYSIIINFFCSCNSMLLLTKHEFLDNKINIITPDESINLLKRIDKFILQQESLTLSEIKIYLNLIKISNRNDNVFINNHIAKILLNNCLDINFLEKVLRILKFDSETTDKLNNYLFELKSKRILTFLSQKGSYCK